MSYELTLTDDEMEFLRQLFSSQLAVTISSVEIIADLKRKVASTAKAPVLGSPYNTTTVTPSS